MEMTFQHSESSQSLRSGSERSLRQRGPSPYSKSESDSATALPAASSASSTSAAAVSSSGHGKGTASRATAFLSNLLGRKSVVDGSPSSSAGPKSPAGAPKTVELPRSSRSMPPSPFSSLKRPSGQLVTPLTLHWLLSLLLLQTLP